MSWRRRRIQVKSPSQVTAMRAAGLVVARTLELLRTHVAPGTTTSELDRLAEEHIRAEGALPSFLGYHGFPASICASVNDEVVHGIPDDRPLAAGDLVSLDCGAIVEGWHGDAALTVPVGDVDPGHRLLADTCERSLWRGLGAVRPGGRLSDISHAIEQEVRSTGEFGIVEGYVGHGIGTEMHQPPDVPNRGRPGRGPGLVPGLVLAVEPMITRGSAATEVLADGWTVVTADGSVAAHVEHTVAVTPDGPWVLTALDGGSAALAGIGAVAATRAG